MSDNDESRPLTRREMRMREMAAADAGASELTSEEVASETQETASDAAAEIIAAANIEISLVDENGQRRSRRELRELREQAEAAALAAAGFVAQADAAEDDTDIEVEPEPQLEPAIEPEPDVEVEVAVEPEAEVAVEPEAEVANEPDPAAETVISLEQLLTQAEALPDAKAEAQVEPAATPEVENTDVKEDLGESYSFPDITPLDEGGSVFDDPTTRLMNTASESVLDQPTGDFDDLINRAVAQEGATGSTGTSALILPNMPDSNGLNGPLGETGELFITGSIDLPRSLGETGGHSSIHDSVEIEPLDELGFSEASPTTSLMAPVAASHAVSMRSAQGPMVSAATKDKSKLPLVLILTGGALVLGAVALIVWAAASGMFG